MKKNIYILIFSLLVLTGFSSSSNVDGLRDTKSMFKAVFIYQFSTLIDWPEDYRKGYFVIEVYSPNDGLYNMLTRKYAGRAIGSQEIVIKKFNPNKIDKCHIIYVSKEYSLKTAKIETSIKNKSTLLITDRPGDLKKGSTINFIIEKNRQQFELSVKSAKKHKLIIASKLKSLAHKVK